VNVVSMTGFAQAQGEKLGIAWVWEMRSVNGKSLDLRLRLPPGFDALEPQLRAMLAQRFRRGNFSGTLTVTRTAPAAVRVNRETLAQLIALMNELAGEIVAAPPRIDGLLALRGVVEMVEDESDAVLEERRRAVLDGWETALDRLAEARAEEGARTAAVLRNQLSELHALVEAVAQCAAVQPAAIRERLLTALAGLSDLAPGMPEERVAQELALLIVRADIREELERLRAHIEQAGDLLRQGEVVGRRLDFLCQELNRRLIDVAAKLPVPWLAVYGDGDMQCSPACGRYSSTSTPRR